MNLGMQIRCLVALFAMLPACAGGGRWSKSAREAPGGPSPVMDVASAAPAKPDAPHDETWKRSQIAANSSRLMVGDHDQLALRTMQTRVTIDGFRARVVIDYLYANDRDQQLEGNFQLRLPEDASPYFFAFGQTSFEAQTPATARTGSTGSTGSMTIAVSERDGGNEPVQLMAQRQSAWISPREARMVPREQAQIAYGETVRRRVDPAIMEWAGAGVFSARVFPLAPHKLHRIVIGYDLDLTRIGNELEYRLELPPKVPSSIVDISVADRSTATTTPAATAQPEPGRRLYHFDTVQDPAITVRVSGDAAPVLANSDSTGAFFATLATPTLPRVAASTSDSAVFLVDTSLSSNPDRFNVWLKLLRAVLESNRGSLKRFDVLFFSVDAHWYKPGFIDNTPDNVDALLTFANELALEGATDLGAALGEASHPAWLGGAASRHDLFLLSDGAATWGEANLHAISRRLDRTGGLAGSLFAYQTGLAGTDTTALAHLARATGGAVFSVTGESEIQRAATAHNARPWQLVAVEVTGASDVLIAGRPASLFPGQSLLVVGRGSIAPNAELVLTLEQAGRRELVKTRLGQPLGSLLAPRAYGQVATGQLEELEAATQSAATAYATHFRVTGRSCSLLMLETDQEYQRFGLHPEVDESIIRSTPAGALFAKTMAQTFATLGDPKTAFLAMIDKLARLPNARLQPSPAYLAALAKMPASDFVVPSAPLATRLRDKRQLSPQLAHMLAKHDLDYDAISNDANARLKRSSNADVLKGLSSLVEENPGDAVLARDVGFSALELGLRAQAYHLFRRVAESRPHEPQTYRAMAQALAGMGKLDLAIAYYEIPLMGQWDPRFGDLKTIVEIDYLRFLRKITTGNASTNEPANEQASVMAYARTRLGELTRKVNLPKADLVISITWNTDNTDVDLHVTEPGGEECFYSHRKTRSGGELTQDVTQGYGPEMYVLPHTRRGQYLVRAHYYASDRNRTSARSKVYVTMIENWGMPNERATERVVTLEQGTEFHELARLRR